MNSKHLRFFKVFKINVLAILLSTSLAGCHRNVQDTPESVVDTFAQSMASMDIESAISCLEYSDEILSLMDGTSDSDFSAAKESELLPDISYEIIDSNIQEDKGRVRVKFTYRFDDGETVHEKSDEEIFPVYLHDGQWWIGEGYTKSQREMTRRGMKFLEKIASQRSVY